MRRNRNGFTLVEMLIVVGIIATLVALLLPALSKARSISRQIACGAELRNIGQALTMCASEHRGYMPLAGNLNIGQVAQGLPAVPANLADPSRVRYIYYTESAGILHPMPMQGALASYMGGRVRDDSNAHLTADITTGVMRTAFTCPADDLNINSQSQAVQITQQNTTTNWFQIVGYSSYCFNAEVFGWAEQGLVGVGHAGTVDHSRARGFLPSLGHPSETMFLADGQPSGGFAGGGSIEIYGNLQSCTLASAYTNSNAGKSQNFDLYRHGGQMNVLFGDGHVDSLTINAAELSRVNLALDFR